MEIYDKFGQFGMSNLFIRNIAYLMFIHELWRQKINFGVIIKDIDLCIYIYINLICFYK